MKSKLSALLDGEAEAHDVSAVCEALRRQPGLRDDVMTYAMIGSCLRGEWDATRNITPKVMAALAAEPVVVVPKRAIWKSFAGALAASAAGALVVATALLVPSKDRPGYTIAHDSADGGRPRLLFASNNNPIRLKDSDVREYVIAHEAQSRGSYVGGGSQQIRTVSMIEESAGR